MFWWVLLLILTIATAVFISAFLLPNIYLKNRYSLTKSGDRGIKKILEKNGMSMVFEPVAKWRKYIKQYVLAERFGKKQLLCKINPEIAYLSYDIALFNSRDEVFNVITIKEKIQKAGYAQIVDLPSETSYVSIAVNEVDATDFTSATPLTAKVDKKSLRDFILWSSLCIFMSTFCIKVCCANVFGGVFKEMFVLNGEGTLATLCIAAVLIVVNLLGSIVTVKMRAAKKSGGSSHATKL